MQRLEKFEALDGKDVHVHVNSRKGNKRALLYIHGFCGSPNSHAAYNMAQLFPSKGIDVWRIELYPGDKNTRNTGTARWQESVSDVQLALEKMAALYPQVAVVGHSLGAALVMGTQHAKIKAKVLWDPFYSENVKITDILYGEIHPEYFAINWGVINVVNKRYTDDGVEASLFNDIPPQPKILNVDASSNFYGWPDKQVPVERVIIPLANHTWDNEGNEEALFKATLKFLKRELR